MFKNKIPHVLTVTLIVGYSGFIFVLKTLGIISLEDFLKNLTSFIGWIVALLILWIQLGKTKRDNQDIKREEIGKSLEREAFKEINKAITAFSSTLVEISTTYLTLPSKLALHMSNPTFFKFDKMDIYSEIVTHKLELSRAKVEFLLPIEANEIAVIKYHHLRTYILLRVDDVDDLIEAFQKYFASLKTEELLTEKGKSDFKERCENIWRKLSDIQMYLFDYRKELMNSLLGDIFLSKVPPRKPGDPRIKILTEVAIKEDVEREAEERGKRALRPKNNF